MEREQAQFGPNSWLIEEMYQQYLDSPDSVSEPWRDFFADYSPDGGAQAQPKTPAPQEPKPETKKAPEHTKAEEPAKGAVRKEDPDRDKAEPKKATDEIFELPAEKQVVIPQDLSAGDTAARTSGVYVDAIADEAERRRRSEDRPPLRVILGRSQIVRP